MQALLVGGVTSSRPCTVRLALALQIEGNMCSAAEPSTPAGGLVWCHIMQLCSSSPAHPRPQNSLFSGPTTPSTLPPAHLCRLHPPALRRFLPIGGRLGSGQGQRQTSHCPRLWLRRPAATCWRVCRAAGGMPRSSCKRRFTPCTKGHALPATRRAMHHRPPPHIWPSPPASCNKAHLHLSQRSPHVREELPRGDQPPQQLAAQVASHGCNAGTGAAGW